MKRLALLGIVGLLGGLVWGGVALATGSGCAVTVDAAVDPTGSIQAAVDAASRGDHICLSGTFVGEPTVFIGTSGITIRPGSMAVLDGGTGPAFSLAGGVRHVTIRDLEIRNRTGGVPTGGVILATEGPTSDITVRNNYIHDNSGLGAIFVRSEGDFLHNHWLIARNVAVNNKLGILLINASHSRIFDNFLRDNGNLVGIVMAALNRLGPDVSPVVSDVQIVNNDVSGFGTLAGIHVLANENTGGPPVPPSSVNGSARITNILVKANRVHNHGGVGIRVATFNPGATADHVVVVENTAVSNGTAGFSLTTMAGPSGPGTLTHNLFKDNISTDNGGDGYSADTDTGANLFRNNRSTANGGFGYNNVSGPNVYKKNQCLFNSLGGSSPVGLCMPQ